MKSMVWNVRGCSGNVSGMLHKKHTYEKRVERVSDPGAFTHIMSDGVYCISCTPAGV